MAWVTRYNDQTIIATWDVAGLTTALQEAASGTLRRVGCITRRPPLALTTRR